MPLDREAPSVTSPCQQLNAFVESFYAQKREEARLGLQSALQAQIAALEKTFTGARQKRSKRFQTPVGTIELIRRAYLENGHYVCKADTLTTGIELSDHGLANRVEALGQIVHESAQAEPTQEVYPLDSALHRAVCRRQLPRSVVYVGVDGLHVPLNRAQGCKEAKVGVIFWEADHVKVSPKRKEVRRKEYVGTLESRDVFCRLVFKRFAEVVKQAPNRIVVLGDGARWIWEMAAEYYPKAIQILDFYHVSEYVWAVARELYPHASKRQWKWVNPQLKRLKASRWEDVVESLRFVKGGPAVARAVKALSTYLQNNASRLDYKRYLELGLMIGSGVVESSNRRVVTQRLKQAGMHWSVYGANAVIALRACYLSSSD